MIELTTGVVFLMSSIYGSGQSDNHIKSINAVTDAGQATTSQIGSFSTSTNMESYLRKEYAETPILVEIARCESEFRQFNKDGTVLRGREVREDVGVMQINERYHAEMASKLGIDIYSVAGNVEYAKHLYKESGTAPWSASKACWSKPADLAKK